MNDALTDRIERLLVRHEESRRTVALLERQVKDLTIERDSLQSRLQAASLRIDAVLQRLPAAALSETTSSDLDETLSA
jgi:cell division septum initiation protein DivIVA